MLLFVKVVILLLVYFVPFGVTLTYDQVKSALPERPRYGGVLGKYIKYPGVRYEPNIASFEGLVRFNKARPSTFDSFVDRIDSILSKYTPEKTHTSEFIDCSSISEYRPPETWNMSCRFDLTSELGRDCVKFNNYGYEDGQPCFILSLDRILNWLPEPYTNETVPEKIAHEWSMYSVTVHCEGEDPVSKDNIGEITYHPENGFHFKYFPNTGNSHWLNPVVFVRLENPNPGIALTVTCSVYAKNTVQYDKLDTGRVSFDVMVDWK